MKEITVITERSDGFVAELSKLLAGARVNIESIDAARVHTHSIVRLTVDRYDDALRAMCDAGIEAFAEDVVIVNLVDQPGALARVTERLFNNGIHVHSIHSLHRADGVAFVAVAMDDPERGAVLIRDLLAHAPSPIEHTDS